MRAILLRKEDRGGNRREEKRGKRR